MKELTIKRNEELVKAIEDAHDTIRKAEDIFTTSVAVNKLKKEVESFDREGFLKEGFKFEFSSLMDAFKSYLYNLNDLVMACDGNHDEMQIIVRLKSFDRATKRTIVEAESTGNDPVAEAVRYFVASVYNQLDTEIRSASKVTIEIA